MKKFKFKKLICLFLAAAMLALCACTAAEKPQNGSTAAPDSTPQNAAENTPSGRGARLRKLSEGVTPASMRGRSADPAFSAAQADFALGLFKNGLTRGENSLVSPLSVLLALAMTANGADGETLAEMERTLGGLSIDELNEYLYTYMNALVSNENAKVNIANSIWYRADEGEFDPAVDCEPLFTPNAEFLAKNAAVYDAEIFSGVFDGELLDALNDWVKEHTDGMIERILDEIDPLSVMYLVNTLLFDAKWDEPYYERNVDTGVFTSIGGERREVEMMHGTEHTFYRGANCTGFAKYYLNSPYAFVALLPDEGVDLYDFINRLTGEELLSMLQNPEQQCAVLTAMPKFSFDYSVELSNALSAMGMASAFNPDAADFSRMGELAQELPLYIGEVIHKTHIEVGELGTRAGAATLVDMRVGSAFNTEIREVTLDRPFVFMIMDMNTNTPLFIGVVTSVN